MVELGSVALELLGTKWTRGNVSKLCYIHDWTLSSKM